MCRALGKLYIIRQARPPIITEENPQGLIDEACAGRMDKAGEDLRALAAREIGEELGMRAREDQIELINAGIPLAASPGGSSEKIYLAYAEIEPSQIREGSEWGLASEHESTRRIEVGFDEVRSYKSTDLKTFALIQWFVTSRLNASPSTGSSQ